MSWDGKGKNRFQYLLAIRDNNAIDTISIAHAALASERFAPLSPEKAQLHADAVASLLGLSSAEHVDEKEALNLNNAKKSRDVMSGATGMVPLEWTVAKARPLRIFKRLSSAEMHSRTVCLPMNIFESLFGKVSLAGASKLTTVLVAPQGASPLALAADLTPDGAQFCVRSGPLFNILHAKAGDALCLISCADCDEDGTPTDPPRAVAMLAEDPLACFQAFISESDHDAFFSKDDSMIKVEGAANDERKGNHKPCEATRAESMSPVVALGSIDVDAASTLLAASTPATEEPLGGKDDPLSSVELTTGSVVSLRSRKASARSLVAEFKEGEDDAMGIFRGARTGDYGLVDESLKDEKPTWNSHACSNRDIEDDHDNNDDEDYVGGRETGRRGQRHAKKNLRKRKAQDLDVGDKETIAKTLKSSAVTARRRGRRSSAVVEAGSLTCSHCGTKETPRWWKDAFPCGSLCNACGIWLKRHGYPRPVQFFAGGQGYISAARVRISPTSTSGHGAGKAGSGINPSPPANNSTSAAAAAVSAERSENRSERDTAAISEALPHESDRTPSGPLANEFYFINGRPRRRRQATAPILARYSLTPNYEDMENSPGLDIDYDSAGDKVFVIRRKLVMAEDGGKGTEPVSVLVHFGWSSSVRSAHKMYDAIVAYNKTSPSIAIEDFELLGETRAKATLTLKPDGSLLEKGWDHAVQNFVNSL